MGTPLPVLRTKEVKLVAEDESEVGLTFNGSILTYTDDEGNATEVLDASTAQTVNPSDDSGVGSVILPASKSVIVGAVVNDANDWIVLPAIAGVAIGHTIRIACNAGGNFELRTPATSGTTINGQDCDGTKEYLCTDTEVITVIKTITTGWIAYAHSALGAAVAAVVPD